MRNGWLALVPTGRALGFMDVWRLLGWHSELGRGGVSQR